MHDTTSIDPDRIPRHVGIIMDGNGRWAKNRGLPRIMGHKAGSESVKNIVTAARRAKISVLTLYAFSTENWNRPATEVQGLMSLLKTYLKTELASMLENRISLRCVGQIERLPKDVQKHLNETIRKTAEHAGDKPGMILNLALSYGSRAEIVRAARRMAERCVQGGLQPDDITEELFSSFLYTGGLPDPDIIIRTGGEARLSNFLLWQASYAEIYITDIMWPDFGDEYLNEAIRYFQNRERRFGKTGEQIEAG